MKTQLKALTAAIVMAGMTLSGCGSSSDSSEQSTSSVSLALSDAPVENLSEVVVVIDYIEVRRNSGDVLRIEQFLDDDDEDTDLEESFTINLLEYTGAEQKLVFEDRELLVGAYQDLRLGIDDENSYVIETEGDERKTLKVPSDELKLGGFEITDRSTQTFVVEFDLRQAMTYNPGPDRYILKPRGVRIIGVEEAATLAGIVDLDEMNSLGVCEGKEDKTVGNVAYLYAGHDLDTAKLGDMFVRDDQAEDGVPAEEDPDVPGDIIAPFASTPIEADGDYLFAELPAGNYTVALSCMAFNDDPVNWDEIAIPSPDVAGAVVEVTLTAGYLTDQGFTFQLEGEGMGAGFEFLAPPPVSVPSQ